MNVRVALIAAVVLAVLVAPGAAPAGVDDYFANRWLDTSVRGNCYYVIGEACSGWNTWMYNYVERGGGGGTDLQGFETGSVIRGRYRSSIGAYRLYASDVSMGGWYTKAGALYWGGPSIWIYDAASVS